MRLASNSPPDFGMSICTPAQACFSINSRKPRQQIEIFAGADRHIGGARHPLHGLDILGRRGVFHPHGMDRLQRIAILDHVIDRIFPVAFHRHVDVGPDLLAHQFHALDQAADVLVGELVGVAVMSRLREGRIRGCRHAVALEFEGGEAEGIVGQRVMRLLAPGLRESRDPCRAAPTECGRSAPCRGNARPEDRTPARRSACPPDPTARSQDPTPPAP